MNSKKQITIVDVAKAAGVSMGTVDRVIHNRGEVSAKSSKKVHDAIELLGYKPNLHAAMLSIKRKYLIIVVIPSYYPGDYWECVNTGIQQVSSEYLNQNMTIETVNFNQFDKASFEKACTSTEEKNPNAVLIAPIYRDCAAVFAKKLEERDVPIVYIDSYMDKTNYLAYYGMPQFESGYLLAHLMLQHCGNSPQRIVNFIFSSNNSQRNHSVQNRLNGIQAYIEEHNIECVVDNCVIEHNNTAGNFRVIESYFAQHPEVNKLMVLNSRAYMIAEWLEIRGINDKVLFGFDALDRNTDSMRRGYIDTLIAENLSQSIHDALMAAIRFLLFKQRPKSKSNYSPMNILNRYNIDFYK